MDEFATQSHNPRIGTRDLAWERSLLIESGIFDELGYIARAGDATRDDPVGHYLDVGWQFGLEPNASLPGSLLQPYFASIGEYGPAAITWLCLRSAGWPMYGSRSAIEFRAHRIRQSSFFNDSYYVAQLGTAAKDLDPAVHYVAVGERLGLAPSPEFDPNYYLGTNPDVASAGINCLLHFIDYGCTEGRLPKAADVRRVGRAEFDSAKENLILVVHDTTRTGAPILGWNLASSFARRFNVFTIRLGEGELASHYLDVSVEVYGPFPGKRRNPIDLEYSLKSFLRERKYAFAIVNSSESRMAIEPLIRNFVPTLFLIHEFASGVKPLSTFNAALDWSTEVVFSAPMVARSAQDTHQNLAARSVRILPQGVTKQPSGQANNPNDESASRTIARLAAKREKDGTFIVLGVGLVQIRKGVDLFLSAAAAIARRHPQRPIHFLWVGDGYRPKDDMNYSVYLQEQIDRSGLSEHVTFTGVMSDVTPAYRIADAYFLCSRLDPLPNSAIDAAITGTPVVCFREASGIADLLLDDPATALGVVDHLDSEAAAQVVLDLASDHAFYERVSHSTRRLARGVFDLEGYFEKLEALGKSTSCGMRQREADFATLAEHPAFDQDMFLGTSRIVEPREKTIHRYLAFSAAHGWNEPPEFDSCLRRPAPGFNPRVYAAAHRESLRQKADPFADFLRRGEPAGPWQTRVVRPNDAGESPVPSGKLRVALHAHLYSPEVCPEFIAHLAPNKTGCDLLITTSERARIDWLTRYMSGYVRGKVIIRVVPSRGGDLGSLLTEFATQLNDYDVIGHIHSELGPPIGQPDSGTSADNGQGDSQREFLWQNLVGGLYPMMDRILAAFAQDENLGLIFPSDPHLAGCDRDRDCAEKLAARIGWTEPLPDHFDFPLGNMFWIRRAALQPLLNLRLKWDQYPEEPLPSDGTLLHALERLTPFACQAAGFQLAVTHVPGITWSPANLAQDLAVPSKPRY
jgi:glycosyltransferase involved in cell wall biosynthesis